MNKVYNIVYNEHTGTWAAVSEHQPKRGKSGRIGLDGNGVSIAAVTTTVALAAAPVSVQAATFADSSTNSAATGINSVAIGQDAKAKTDSSIAVGNYSHAYGGINAIAIGTNTVANGYGATAIGISANASAKHAHAIGDITNVSSQAAVGVGLINNIHGASSQSSAFGYQNKITDSTSSQAIGTKNEIISSQGKNTSGSTAVGNNNKIFAENGVALGGGNQVSGKNAVAIGQSGVASKENAVAIGQSAKALHENSIAIGQSGEASNKNAVAIGQSAKATHENSVAIGSKAVAGSPETVTALPNKDANGNTQYQSYAGNQSFAVLSVGSKNYERQIQHVAPGRVNPKSTDAVNGSQLYEVATKTGFNLSENGTSKARINNDNVVNFVNTDFTTAEVGRDGSVKIKARTQDITVDNRVGTVAAAAGDAGLASTATVVNAINNSGFTLQANGKDGGLVKAGDTVNIQKGTNIEISKAGNTITINTSDSPTFTTVTAKKVTGLDDAKNDKDAVNFGQMNKAIAESKGSWQLGANNDAALGTVNASNNIVRIIQGKNIKVERDANNITVKTDDNVTFSNVTVTNNLSTNNLTATGETKLGNLTVNQGSTVNMGGNAITNIGESNDNKSAATVKQVNEVKNLVAGGTKYVGNIAIDNYDKVVSRKLGEQLEIVGGAAATQGDYSAKNTRTRSGNGKVEIQFADSPDFENVNIKNDLTVDGKTTLNNGLTVGNGTTNLGATNIAGTLNMGGNQITGLKDGEQPDHAVTVNQLNNVKTNVTKVIDGLSELSEKPLTFKGNTGEVERKLGQTLSVTGALDKNKTADGKNIRTHAKDSGEIEILFSDSPEFKNVNVTDTLTTKNLNATGTTNLKNTTIDGGLTVKSGGINMNGTTITGLGNATNDSDAVNYKQVKEIAANLTKDGTKYAGNIGKGASRKLGEILTIKGGIDDGTVAASSKNIRTKADGDTVTIEFADSPNFDNVTVTHNLTTNNLTATGKTNLNGDTVIGGNLTTKGDTVLEKSLMVKGDTNLNKTTVNGDLNVTGDTVIGGTGKNFTVNNGTTVHFGNNTLSHVGKAEKGGDAVNYDLLNTTVANSAWKLGINNQADGNLTDVKANNIVRIQNGTNTLVSRNGNDIKVETVANPKFENVTATNLNATGTTTLGGEVKLLPNTHIHMGDNIIHNVTAGVKDNDAVNVAQLQALNTTLTDKGLSYKGNNDDIVTRKLGGRLDIVGNATTAGNYSAANVRTQSGNGKVEIQFADSPEFKNVTVSDTLTTKDLTVNGNTNLKGDTTIGGDGKTFNVAGNTTVNFGGNRITNVGTAQDKNDAVNYELLNTTIANVNDSIANSAWKLGVNDKALIDVKAGNEVRVLQGRNIEVRRDGHNITVETVLNPVFENITADSLNATTVNATNITVAQNLNVGGNTTLQTTTVNGAFTANDKVFLNGDTVIGGTGRKSLTVVKDTHIDMGGNIIHNVKAGEKPTDAVNLDQMQKELKALNTTLTGLGLKFKGNNETEEVLRPLGSTLTVRGDLDKNAAANSDNLRTRTDPQNGTVLVEFALNPVFGNVTTQDLTVNGNTTIGGDGKTFNVAGNTTVNFGGNTVSNIGDAKNKTDATNLGQVESLIANTTANLTGLGMNYAGDVGDSFKRDLGSTVTISGGLDKNAAANSDNLRTRTDPQNGTVLVEFALNPVFGNVTTHDLTVNGTTNLKGDTTIGGDGKTFNVAGNTTVNFGGNSITNIGDAKNAGDATNLGQVQNLIANSVNATTANLTNLGMKFKGDNDEVVLRPLGEMLAVRGDGKNISTQSNKDTNEITVMMAENPVFGNVTTKDLTVDGNTTIGGADKAFNVAAGTKVDMGGNVITNIGAGDVSQNSKDAVNGSQLYQLTELVRSTESKLADGGMTFTGNSGSTPRKLGQTLEIVGAGSTAGSYSSANIRTQVSDGKVEIQMADSPVLQNLQVNGSTTLNNAVVNGDLTANGNVTVGGNGKHFTVAEGTTVNLGGNSITNIQPGTVADGSSDVITGGQLYQVANRFGDGLGRLAARVDDVDKDLRGGVAGAVASSLLPQAMNPAERLVAVSAGTYRGASALAVGYSQVTDNGKYIVKFAGSVNNRKHVSAGVAVGYRF